MTVTELPKLLEANRAFAEGFDKGDLPMPPARPVAAHYRELLEQGFEVTVVKDATAAAQHSELGDGYASALTNFGFIANAVVTTEEAVGALRGA